MSTIALRAVLVREIENAMKRVNDYPAGPDGCEFQSGQLDAYAHILMLLKDDEDL